jgi:hypothetical protein
LFNRSRLLSILERIAVPLLLIVAAAEVVAFLAMPFDGYDSPSHIFWVHEWRKMWAEGVLYPRWMPDSYHGFGAPSFYLYPPLAYVISSAIGLVAPDAGSVAIIKIVTLITLLLSGVAMYLYLRWRNASAKSSLLLFASLIYAFAPYRFFNMTVRAAFSEHVAFIFAPLAFWGLDLLLRARREKRLSRAGLALLTFSLALTLLSNLPAAASVVLLLGVYALAQRERWWLVGMLAISGAVAVLLSAVYLVPVVAFYHDAHLDKLWRAFPFAQCSPILGIFTREAVMINTYGLVGLLGAAALLYAMRNEKSAWKWLLVAIVVLQLPPFAYYLFLYVFPFTIVQLPARLMIGALIIAAIMWTGSEREHRAASFVAGLWALCLIPLIVIQFNGIHIRAWLERLADDPPEYATRWSPAYEGKTIERVAADTGWFAKGANIISVHRTAYSDTVRYESNSPAMLTLHRAYWPTWQAVVDSSDVKTSPDSFGRLQIDVPQGTHRVVGRITSSTGEITGRWVSAIACALFVLTLLAWRPKASRLLRARSRSSEYAQSLRRSEVL